MACHILNGEGGQVQHRLYGESDLDVLPRHGVEVLGDRFLFVDGDAVAPQLADERLQVEGSMAFQSCRALSLTFMVIAHSP